MSLVPVGESTQWFLAREREVAGRGASMVNGVAQGWWLEG